ncbi:MAG TPA: hypothetical protein VFM36_10265 [Thermoanaerobaculia bacterium]|nr:hypothetical protein [Thermoanaerobaculia bacterium]
MSRSLKILLDGLIDYAGLFPPASLPMEEAVANYDRYRRGPFAWALGRFVVQAERLAQVPRTFSVSVLATPDNMPAVDVVEIKAASEEDIQRIAAVRGNRTVYVEVADVRLLDAIAEHGLRAKIRTGGVTLDAIPAAERVAAFIQACRDRNLAFKATAGLHHPIRCVRPLTYEADAPVATMHGFLNVFIAAALPQFATQILLEENPRAFAFDDGGLWWHDLRVTSEELVRLREQFAISFGSCSFEEPIADLKESGWL